jgi:hypothetical protein
MIVYIYNNFDFHYEIIETIINRYNLIINNNDIADIYLYVNNNKNYSFTQYIKRKYPKIQLKVPSKFDYYINCTIYSNNYNSIKNNDANKYFFICHDVNKIFVDMNNVYFLTELGKRYIYADILPFQDQKKVNNNIPIFCIQGSIAKHRRNFTLLEKILQKKYNYNYKIKIIGYGELDNKFNKYKNNLIIKSNLDFINYHKEFLDCYCIIPLITKKSHPHYYSNKLTSSISYAKAYNLKCLIDKDLQDIYNLPDTDVFNDENDVADAFERILIEFYKDKVVDNTVEIIKPIINTNNNLFRNNIIKYHQINKYK